MHRISNSWILTGSYGRDIPVILNIFKAELKLTALTIHPLTRDGLQRGGYPSLPTECPLNSNGGSTGKSVFHRFPPVISAKISVKSKFL